MDPKQAAQEIYRLLMECQRILGEIYPKDNETIYRIQILINDALNHIRRK